MSSTSPTLGFDWPFAYGGPGSSYQFKSRPEDFIVKESLGFELTEDGEHLCLWLEKTGLNTQYIAEQLSQFMKTRLLNIGYSGLKDRQGVTTQWFSVPVKIGCAFDVEEFCQQIGKNNPNEHVRVLEQKRHQKKIRRGVHKANVFQIRLRSLTSRMGGGEDASNIIDLQLNSIQQSGFPNYFGEQRFGRDNQNVSRGLEWLSSPVPSKLKPAKRGIYLSAIRSYLFNSVLAKRVEQGTWCQLLRGESVILDGSHSIFQVKDEELGSLEHRLLENDIHPSGPLFGSDTVPGESELSLMEYGVYQPYEDSFRHPIMKSMKAVRRALRAIPEALEWSWEGSDLLLKFSLPAGSYATALIRELGTY